MKILKKLQISNWKSISQNTRRKKLDVRHFKKELIVNMLQAVSTNYDFSMQFKNQMY